MFFQLIDTLITESVQCSKRTFRYKMFNFRKQRCSYDNGILVPTAILSVYFLRLRSHRVLSKKQKKNASGVIVNVDVSIIIYLCVFFFYHWVEEEIIIPSSVFHAVFE